MGKQKKEESSTSHSSRESTKAEKASNESNRIGARGYGLDKCQQEAIADLWAWQEASLKSDIILGGPIK